MAPPNKALQLAAERPVRQTARRASMPERSIHDNRVVSFEVQGDRRHIVLHTRFEEREPDYRSLFGERSKYAWPGPWNESPETPITHFQSRGAKAFEISSAYGLSGWSSPSRTALKRRPASAPSDMTAR